MKRRIRNQSLCKTRLHVESLEQRRLLAADIMVFQNPIDPLDVNLDQFVSPVDALAIINELNTPDSTSSTVGAFLDASGDHILAPIDALSIINDLNNPTDTPNQLEGLHVAHDFLKEHHAALPIESQAVADELTKIVERHEAANDAIYTRLQDFQNFSLQNLDAVNRYFEELQTAVLLNKDTLQRGLAGISDDIHEVSTNTFGNDETTDPLDTTVPYEFDPDDYDNPIQALPDLFEELDQGLDDIEIPGYGDLIDNYDEIYQTYHESDYEIDVYVIDTIDVNEYENFVLNGGELDDLVDELESGIDQGITTIDEILDPSYHSDLNLGLIFDDLLDSTYVGELIYNDVAAIGGETTGSVVILSTGDIVEVDFGDSIELRKKAELLDNQVVVLEGIANIVEGIEVPDRTVIDARSLFGEEDLESLVNVITTLAPADSVSLITKLNELNLG